MKVLIDNKYYDVIIVKKSIKNTYLRIKEDMKLHVSTNYFVNNKMLEKYIYENVDSVRKMITYMEKKLEKKENFYYLGKCYDVVLCNMFKTIYFDGNTIFIKKHSDLTKYVKKETYRIFKERLDYYYDLMKNEIIYPKMVIRKMTRKWGHCNKNTKTITLNSDLIKYEIEEIDYVIVHELCHLIHFDHSKAFWNSVKKYKPNYKDNRKVLNEE